MANSILSTVEVDMDLRSIVLRLGRYRILLECRSLYPLSSDLCTQVHRGAAPSLRISRKKGSFFKTSACP